MYSMKIFIYYNEKSFLEIVFSDEECNNEAILT